MEVTETITSIVITLALFATILLSLYYYFRARNQVKMAMIEKGYQPPQKSNGTNKSLRSLKFGTFFIGIGVGIFFGYLMTAFTVINPVVSYFFMILLFGGVGLVINYYLESKINKKKD